jgi:hypothetical protein
MVWLTENVETVYRKLCRGKIAIVQKEKIRFKRFAEQELLLLDKIIMGIELFIITIERDVSLCS